MSLSDISIRNPVFAVMLSAAMVIFGYLGYRELGISQFPEIDFPVVNVTTYWEAASPETMDHDVTDVIEDAVSSVEGIDYLQSQSLEGVSVVTVFFHLSRDIDVAMQDVQNAVAAAMHRLPTGVDPPIDPPVVSKVNFNKYPVIWLSVHGPRPLQEISDFVDTRLKQRIESIPGCGGVMYGGLRRRNMRVWLDSARLHAYGLDAFDVRTALAAQHVEKPAGYLQGQRRELNVRTLGEARTADEFARIPILHRDNQLVRLGDVAVVEDGLEDRRGFARFNREPNVGIGVLRATGSNVVEVCEEVKRRLPELRKLLPRDAAGQPLLELSISTDYSLFIKDDIAEVQLALFLGIALTAVVTFCFLGSMGTTANVCVSIPASLVGTFSAMHWLGYTVNFMTLLALSLSVGVVVDDAILVLENIYRRLEHGEARRAAAQRGARQISFAALAATLSIAAIFIPVAFLQGSVGLFLRQFAVTVTVAVLLSLVVALTVTPMLSAIFLRVRPMRRPSPPPLGGRLGPLATLLARAYWVLDRWLLEPLFIAPVNALMHALTRGYAGVLRQALRHQWWVVPASFLLAASALLFAFGLDLPLPGPVAQRTGVSRFSVKPIGQELIPSEDQSRFVVSVICPVGSSIDYVDDMIARGEAILAGLRDPVTDVELVRSMFAAVSIRPGQLISEGILFVRLAPADERTWTQTQVMNEVREGFAGIPGVRVVVLDLSTQGFTPTRGYPVDFAVQGPDWETVTQLSERVRQRMSASGLVTDVNSDYRPGMPELQVVPDRIKAAELGVSVQRIAYTLNVAFGGMRSGRFTDADRRYDVRLRFLEPQRSSPDHLDNVYVKTDSGRLVPLSDVTTRRMVSTLPVINRYNHMRKVELTANMVPGVPQGEAVARSLEIAQQVREEMGLPASYRFVQLGNAQAMQHTLASLWWCLVLGFVFAYMILGCQFNSFVHPLTVLVAVPFGVTGALATLWYCGDTLNLMSMIGLVLLAGLVKKNSIILVDYTNQLREGSHESDPAPASARREPPGANGRDDSSGTNGENPATANGAAPLPDATGERRRLSAREAVLAACPVRLRPILMTSLATIAAALPLAFGVGPGAETRAPLARSIIGGIILSTLVTLIIVPIFYLLFDRFGAWMQRLTRREEKHRGARPALRTIRLRKKVPEPLADEVVAAATAEAAPPRRAGEPAPALLDKVDVLPAHPNPEASA
jgi:multidrug efflux pump subunit AcrB